LSQATGFTGRIPVTSEGDKVLAGIEVGNVNDVKTVINDLEVKGSGPTEGHLPALSNPNGAQTQQLSPEARTYPTPTVVPGVPVGRTITIPANTSIQVRITDPLTTSTAASALQYLPWHAGKGFCRHSDSAHELELFQFVLEIIDAWFAGIRLEPLK
jgi:hypothetical protein